jgi:hemerythrin-like domain-containing protein
LNVPLRIGMKITDAFTVEHAVLYAQLDHLEKAVPAARTLGEVQAMAALLESALSSHADLEDLLLLDGLNPGLAQMGKLEKVHSDHDAICGGLAKIRQSTRRADAQRLLLAVVQITRKEFDLEDRVIFKIAEENMHPDTLEKLGKTWARKRGVPLRQ